MNDTTYRPEARQNSAYCRGEVCRYRLYGHEPAGREWLYNESFRQDCLANKEDDYIPIPRSR